MDFKKKSDLSLSIWPPGDPKGILQFSQKQGSTMQILWGNFEKLNPDFFFSPTFCTENFIAILSWDQKEKSLFSPLNLRIWFSQFSKKEKSSNFFLDMNSLGYYLSDDSKTKNGPLHQHSIGTARSWRPWSSWTTSLRRASCFTRGWRSKTKAMLVSFGSGRQKNSWRPCKRPKG